MRLDNHKVFTHITRNSFFAIKRGVRNPNHAHAQRRRCDELHIAPINECQHSLMFLQCLELVLRKRARMICIPVNRSSKYAGLFFAVCILLEMLNNMLHQEFPVMTLNCVLIFKCLASWRLSAAARICCTVRSFRETFAAMRLPWINVFLCFFLKSE